MQGVTVLQTLTNFPKGGCAEAFSLPRPKPKLVGRMGAIASAALNIRHRVLSAYFPDFPNFPGVDASQLPSAADEDVALCTPTPQVTGAAICPPRSTVRRNTQLTLQAWGVGQRVIELAIARLGCCSLALRPRGLSGIENCRYSSCEVRETLHSTANRVAKQPGLARYQVLCRPRLPRESRPLHPVAASLSTLATYF